MEFLAHATNSGSSSRQHASSSKRNSIPTKRSSRARASCPRSCLKALKVKAIDAGLYAANMPTEVGGAGLDAVSCVFFEKELGRTSYALQFVCVARPSNILLACAG